MSISTNVGAARGHGPQPPTRKLIIRSPTTVREASASEIAQWDELVMRFPQYGLCHKLAWVRSLEASGRGKPLFLIFERGQQIAGCLPGLLVRAGPLRVFGSPLPGWQSYSMGPVFDPEQVSASELTAALIPFLVGRHVVHHIEMIS